MKTEKLFTRRQVGVCGSSSGLSDDAIEFCRTIGEHLASYPSVTIITSGTKQAANASARDFAADWHIVDAASKSVKPEAVLERFITVLREDDSGAIPFVIGAQRKARGKTGEARRISFVRDVDALIAVGGGGGTAQELALAIEHDIPVMPVPTFSGAAQDVWKSYRSEIVQALRIDEQRAERWEQPAPTDFNLLRALAIDMVDALIASLPRRCFVVMPFKKDFDQLYEKVIYPAIKRAGNSEVRVDRASLTGDAVSQIDKGIRNCEYAVVVLDGLRPNVLYELGLAHGRDKHTILLNKEGALGEEGIAFDIYTRHRLEYAEANEELQEALLRVINTLPLR